MDTELLLRYASRMPALPKLVQEIIQAFNQPNVDADLIASKVMQDQALTAKILRLANSSFYGGRRRIESASDAVVLLGFDALRNLVIASAVANVLNQIADHLDFTAFWRKSYMVAALAKWLIRRCGARGPTPDTAFTAGLLHEIGALVLHALEPALAARVELEVKRGVPRDEAEQAHFGCTSSAIGAELCRRWYFPESLVRAVAEQDAPLAAAYPSPYALVVQLAKTLYLLTLARQPAQLVPVVSDAAVAGALQLKLTLVEASWEETRELAKAVESLL